MGWYLHMARTVQWTYVNVRDLYVYFWGSWMHNNLQIYRYRVGFRCKQQRDTIHMYIYIWKTDRSRVYNWIILKIHYKKYKNNRPTTDSMRACICMSPSTSTLTRAEALQEWIREIWYQLLESGANHVEPRTFPLWTWIKKHLFPY